jgi:hypothetical protein
MVPLPITSPACMDEIEIMALSTVLNCTEQIFLSAKVQGGNG